MTEFSTPGPITLDVRIGGGSVEVHAEPRDTAVVEVTPYDDSQPAREAAEQTRVELTGDTLAVTAPDATGWVWRRGPRVRVSARVPAGSTGRFRVAAADLTGHGEWSQAKVNTASGNIDFGQVTGDLTVNTASGDLWTRRVGGRLTVKTASGEVSARHVAGSVDVKSASGDVRVDEVGSDASVTTATGDILLAAARQGRVRANAVSGDVSVSVVPGTGVWLDLNTLSGRTRSDLDMDSDDPVPPTGHALAVQVRTVSGDIEIRRATLPAQT